MPSDVDAVIVRIIATQKEYEKQMANVARAAERAAAAAEKSFARSSTRIAANVNTAGRGAQQGFTGASQAAGQLSFQLNDIATSMTGGMSPFQIMMQQGSQVVQVMQQVRAAGGSMGQVVVGAFTSMLNPMALISFGLIALVGYAYQYFTAAEEGSDKAEEAFRKQIDAIEGLTDKYKDFLSETSQQALSDIVDEQDFAKAEEQVKQGIESIRQRAAEELSKMDQNMPEIDFGAGVSFDIGTENAETFRMGWEHLIEAVTKGEQPLERINELITFLDAVDLQSPTTGAKGLADMLRSQVLPFLKTFADRQKALNELAKVSTTTTKKGIEEQKKFNDAMEEMRKIAEPTKTEYQKMWDAYIKAVKAAHGDLVLLVQAQEQLKTSLGDLEQAQLVGGGVGKQIRFEEKFRGTPYPDVTGLAIGYGMHQIYDEQGNKRMITEGMRMTFQEAERQLEIQLPKYVKTITDKIGTETWNELNESQKAALASVAWNYGHLPDAVANAVKSGDTGQVQRAIAGLSANKERRRREAELYGREAPEGADAALAVGDLTEKELKQVEVEKKLAAAKGETGKAIDEKVAKEVAETEYIKLRAEADEKALKRGKDLTDAEIADLHRIADARGRLAGEEAAAKAAKESAESYEARLQAMRDEAHLLEMQVAQQGAATAAIDQKKVAQEALIEAERTYQQLQANGVILTEGQKAAILSAATATATAKAQLKEYNTAQQEVSKSQEQFANQVSQIAQSAIGGFIQDLRNGVEAGEAFSNMLDRIIDGLINMALQSLFSQNALGGVISSLIGGIGGGGVTAIGAAAGGTVGLSRHTDGRKFSAALWAGAPRYAMGGVVGLRPGEVPIIAHKGEVIIPTAKATSGQRATVNQEVHTSLGDVNIDMSKTGMAAASSDDAKKFGSQIQKLIQMEMVRESRPGGLLRRVP